MNLLTSFIVYLFVAVLLGTLLFFVGQGGYNLYETYNSLTHNDRYQWEQIEGDIVEVVLNKRPNPNLPEETAMVFPLMKCIIKYSYSHKGETFTNASIGLNSEKHYDSYFHSKLYSKLEDKKKVMVYYNPNNPAQSALIKYDVDLRNMGEGIAMLIFPLLLGCWIFIHMRYSANYLTDRITVVA
ncbi:DUF3592 domain-containing protein [Arenibacter sp. H213]|uniref:DUF3592 domain-containing protein n=1 Tax=Arenibacter antarcticus TaxID=2040469 RepID=A0ABW5VEL8_9FLAO|nr:DUF3592 domain-containing protein [Arenibacter sp. H213]